MKLSRDELKGIVKECLVEILSEGLVGSRQQIAEARSTPPQERQGAKQQAVQNPRALVADKINFLPKSQAGTRPAPKVDKQAISAATSDPILQEMLSDTAIRGTPILEDSRRGQGHDVMVAAQGDAAAKIMLRSDPEDIFGDSASKWATLAFSEKKVGV